jgi:hypothetical protein
MFGAKDRLQQGPTVSVHPLSRSALARIDSNFRQELQNRPRVFSSLHTLLSARKLQATYCQSLAHSLVPAQNITTVFSVAYGFILRSWAPERQSTPLFSKDCALFREKVEWREPDLCCAPHRSAAKTARPHLTTTQLHSAKRSDILRRLLVSQSHLGGSQ